jgi:hypothetical protein
MSDLLLYLPVLNLITTVVLVPLIGYIIKIERKIAVIETTLGFMNCKIDSIKNDGIIRHE